MAASAVRQVVPDHHVDHAELVLQGDEGDAAGGLWALPADHQAGDPYRSPMSQFRQFAGVAAAAGLELSTQEFQRMRAEGGAEERNRSAVPRRAKAVAG